MDRILLIDGLNFIHRANIKFKWSENNNDEYIVVYNFFRNLRALVEEFNPSKVFFCIEGKNNFRYSIYPKYKANRIIKLAENKDTDKFFKQKSIILDLLKKLPITIVYAEKYEADDVIASLSENLKDENVIIISNDNDFIQLKQRKLNNVKIYNPFKKCYVEPPSFFHLTYKCLLGDKSDNIQGLVGKKTAENLATDPVKFAIFIDDKENRDRYILNKDLIELKTIADDELIFEDYNIDFDCIKKEFEKMEFKTLIEEKYWERFCNTFSDLK